MSGSNRDRDRVDREYTTEQTTSRAARQDVRDTDGEIHVPVAEERIEVGKREGEIGEVEIRKTVVQEQVSIPVELAHEEVRVEERDIADRPAQAGDQLFQEGVIRVPVRGEEAVVQKEAVVTGEVVIDKERLTETQNITDTVRRERVEVEEAYNQRRGEFQQHFTQRQAAMRGTQGTTRTFEEAEPNYRTGFTAAHDERYQGREFDEIEPSLRSEYETRQGRSGGDAWQHLREEIREGWTRARRR